MKFSDKVISTQEESVTEIQRKKNGNRIENDKVDERRKGKKGEKIKE